MSVDVLGYFLARVKVSRLPHPLLPPAANQSI